MLGENAGMPEFIKVLKDALSGFGKPTVEAPGRGGEETQQDVRGKNDKFQGNVERVVDPLWAAARGAALYARFRQEVPWECMEPYECNEDMMDITEKADQLFLGVESEL